MKNWALLLCLFVFCNVYSQTINLSLNTNWSFRKSGDVEWLPATVPGTVHTDLLNNKKITDPFYGSNENQLQWIGDSVWEYRTFFTCSKEVLSKQNAELIFEGLDTYANVYFNDSLILRANNMFRTWKVDCKKYLSAKNELKIVFEPAVKKGTEEAKKLPYTLPGEDKAFVRKAQYQYGWDWGPRFVTCGVWKPVTLIAWNKIKIEDVRVVQEKLTDSIAELNFIVEVNCAEEGDYKFSVLTDNTIVAEKSVHLLKGIQLTSVRQEIKDPKLWHSNGLGAATLYSFTCSVADNKGVLDLKSGTSGLRTVELVQEKDSIGKSFLFKVNGAPVFMKGANWIPSDNFLPRVSREKLRELLTEAKNTNMNMLRVWGGGVYESDDFYSLCDSLGILIWQDFMFACAMYPGDSAFNDNVISEAKDNIRRLRNHPSLALWCGNNEIDEGWKNWGWQEALQYSPADSVKIWSDYTKLFEEILPDVVKENDSRNYISTSPLHGWGTRESMYEGDVHYWGVWWGMMGFEMYESKVGRFMSEYGFQGMPELSTFKKFCSNEELSLKSEAVLNHQKHPTGYETIQNYLERDYRQPKDFESYIYVSQLLQAEGMKKAIEAHRSAKQYCMGTLYWQLNDCWPVTSWSSLDYYGNLKATHYVARKAYAPYMVAAKNIMGAVNIIVVSDDTAKVNARLQITVEDFDGNILKTDSGSFTLENKKGMIAFRSPRKDIVSNTYFANAFIKMELIANGKLLAENVYYFFPPKNLLLTKKEIKHTLQPADNHSYSLTLSCDALAKNVCIGFGETKAALSDNYFDLLPKEKKTITVSSEAPLKELEKSIQLKSLVDTY